MFKNRKIKRNVYLTVHCFIVQGKVTLSNLVCYQMRINKHFATTFNFLCINTSNHLITWISRQYHVTIIYHINIIRILRKNTYIANKQTGYNRLHCITNFENLTCKESITKLEIIITLTYKMKVCLFCF